MNVRNGLMTSASRFFFAPADEGAGGGGAVVETPAVPGAEAGTGVASPPAAGAEGGEPVKPALTALAAAVAPVAAEQGGGETAEQIAARELAEKETADAATAAARAELLKNETPEQKATREAEEKTAADAVRAEQLKPYDVLTLPDGMPKEQPAYINFVSAAADAGVAPDVAQKLLDTVAPEIQKAVNAPFETWATTVEGWAATCAADPEFGGAQYEANMGIAATAIDKIGGKEAQAFRDMLAFTGIGNNPEFIRFVFRAGKMVSEGGPVGGEGAGATKDALSTRMYPEMAAKS